MGSPSRWCSACSLLLCRTLYRCLPRSVGEARQTDRQQIHTPIWVALSDYHRNRLYTGCVCLPACLPIWKPYQTATYQMLSVVYCCFVSITKITNVPTERFHTHSHTRSTIVIKIKKAKMRNPSAKGRLLFVPPKRKWNYEAIAAVQNQSIAIEISAART